MDFIRVFFFLFSSSVILSKLFISFEVLFFYKNEVIIFVWNKCGDD